MEHASTRFIGKHRKFKFEFEFLPSLADLKMFDCIDMLAPRSVFQSRLTHAAPTSCTHALQNPCRITGRLQRVMHYSNIIVLENLHSIPAYIR